MAEQTQDPPIVQTQDPDSGPPSPAFKKMAEAFEKGMKEIDEARYAKQEQEKPSESTKKKTETKQEKPKPAQDADNVDSGGDKSAVSPAQKPDGGKTGDADVHVQPASDKPLEQPKKEEPQPETKPEDEIPEGLKNASPKARENFAKLKKDLGEKIKARQAEIAGLRRELDAEKAKSAAPVVDKSPELLKQIEQLQAERSQLVEQIERASLEASPRFQAKYSKAFAELQDTARAAAGETNTEKVLGLLQMPPSKYRKEALSAVMAEMNPVDQGMLSNVFFSADRLRTQRDAELANHKELLQQEQAAAMAHQTQEQQVQVAKREYLIQEVLKAAQDYEAFNDIEGDDAHNKDAALYREEIGQYIRGEIDEAASALLPVLAAQGQYLQNKKVPQLEAKIKELEGTIAEMSGANPKPTGGTKGEQQPEKKLKTFTEAFLEQWNGPALGA